MKKDCCGQVQHLEAQAGDTRCELAKLRALLEVLGDALTRLNTIDRAVIETKIRLIERTHGR